ncbi:MAG TPA: hypothetical protein VFU05_07825, partial [Cyclobacteriaceae bacterium]|nr:hypothetical protein [Cyclobacteriaceae bacterium]
NVENSSFPFDKAEMLMLRRHEKDFFLRKDLKYQVEFNNRLETFSASLREQEGSSEILDNLNNYLTLFNEVVDIEKKIGLKESAGYKGLINQDLSQLRSAVALMRGSIKQRSIDFKNKSQFLLVMILAAQLVLGIVLTITYSHMLTKAIKELQRAMQSVSDGIFPKAFILISTTIRLRFHPMLNRRPEFFT